MEASGSPQGGHESSVSFDLPLGHHILAAHRPSQFRHRPLLAEDELPSTPLQPLEHELMGARRCPMWISS